jgi:hypothetical protein
LRCLLPPHLVFPQISLTTDSANDLVLHWGITKQGACACTGCTVQ